MDIELLLRVYSMYKIETHMHVSETSGCAHLTADEMIKRYAEAGYDTVFLTDHYVKNYFLKLGGVDLCLGGLGINGHLAFNEAAEEDDPITAEEFGALGTRVLKITRETRTINAYGYQRGDLRGMPEWCITIGMKQILESRRIYIALNRPWQHGIFKHVLFDKPQAQIPASLLQGHKSVEFCAMKSVGEGLFE